MDMPTLETCLLKVNIFTSLGTLLLWKDNYGLASVAKYLCSFWPASIMLILPYFHRCNSERPDIKIIFIHFQMFMTSFISGSLGGIDDYFWAVERPNLLSLDWLSLFQLSYFSRQWHANKKFNRCENTYPFCCCWDCWNFLFIIP